MSALRSSWTLPPALVMETLKLAVCQPWHQVLQSIQRTILKQIHQILWKNLPNLNGGASLTLFPIRRFVPSLREPRRPVFLSNKSKRQFDLWHQQMSFAGTAIGSRDGGTVHRCKFNIFYGCQIFAQFHHLILEIQYPLKCHYTIMKSANQSSYYQGKWYLVAMMGDPLQASSCSLLLPQRTAASPPCLDPGLASVSPCCLRAGLLSVEALMTKATTSSPASLGLTAWTAGLKSSRCGDSKF